MAKKKIDNEIFKTLIEDYNIKDTNDIKDMLKDLLSGTIQTMLEAEIEHELGYAKHSMKDKTTSNARNGHSKKTVRSEYGNIDLDIPRDRNAEEAGKGTNIPYLRGGERIDKRSSEGNITKHNNLKKTAKNILLCYFGCPYIFYSVFFISRYFIFFF